MPAPPVRSRKRTDDALSFTSVQYLSLKESIREWSFDNLAGFFSLRGDNPLTRNDVWTRLQRIASRKGVAVLVCKEGNNKNQANYKSKVPNNLESWLEEEDLLLVGAIKEIKYTNNILRTLESVSVEYHDWRGDRYAEEDLLKTKFANKAFFVFKNGPSGRPDLIRGGTQLDVLDLIFRSSILDLHITRPRMVVKSKDDVTREAKLKIKRDLDKWGLIGFISPDNKRPFELDHWAPKSRADGLRMMWDWYYTLYKELNNIRFNPSKKIEGRLPVKEVELNKDQFEGIEMDKQQVREYFLRLCYKWLGGYDYQLIREGKVVFRIGDRYGGEWYGDPDENSAEKNDNKSLSNKDEKDKKKDKDSKDVQEDKDNKQDKQQKSLEANSNFLPRRQTRIA